MWSAPAVPKGRKRRDRRPWHGIDAFSGSFTAYASVDGKEGVSLAMTPLPNGIQPYAPLGSAAATGLFRILSNGQTLSLFTSNSRVQPPGPLQVPLQGAAQALEAMNAECLLGQPNGSVVLVTDVAPDPGGLV